MAIRPALFEDETRYVALMYPLHDDDNGTIIQVVEPVGDGLTKPTHGIRPNHIRLRLVNVVWIVDNDSIASFSGAYTLDRGSELRSRLVVGDLDLVFFLKIESITAQLLVPFTHHEFAELGVVALGQAR